MGAEGGHTLFRDSHKTVLGVTNRRNKSTNTNPDTGVPRTLR